MDEEYVEMLIAECKRVGNLYFSQQNYPDAIRTYTAGLEEVPSNIDLVSNRSVAYLKLGLYRKALIDADTVLSDNPTHDKCRFRKVKALWGLNRYEDAFAFVQANKIQGIDLDKASKLVQQSKGDYDMSEIMIMPREECLDVGEYVGPVKIESVHGKGRGLIATEDIPVGNLIICSKAFAISFDKDVISCKKNNNITVEWNNENTCGGLVYSKIMLDETLKSSILDLYSGADIEKVPDEDLMHRLINIVKFNAFKCEANTTISKDDGSRNCCGLWTLPSYLNHSCIDSNAYHIVVGDLLFVRALKPIKKGDEVTISYWPPTVPNRRKVMQARKFECDCRSCRMEKAEKGTNVQATIDKLLTKIRNNLDGNVDANFERIEKIVQLRKGKEATNVALLCPEVEMVGRALTSKNEDKKAIFILEKMHEVCANTVFVRSSVIQALATNICRRYLELEDVCNVRKWWSIYKANVVAAYGCVKNGIKVLNLIDTKEFDIYENLASDLTLSITRKALEDLKI